jgi:hypothetical protein
VKGLSDIANRLHLFVGEKHLSVRTGISAANDEFYRPAIKANENVWLPSIEKPDADITLAHRRHASLGQSLARKAIESRRKGSIPENGVANYRASVKKLRIRKVRILRARFGLRIDLVDREPFRVPPIGLRLDAEKNRADEGRCENDSPTSV